MKSSMTAKRRYFDPLDACTLYHEGRPWLQKPRGIRYAGKPWTVASDGRLLVAVRRARRRDRESANAQGDAESILNRVQPTGETLTLAALRRWAGRAPRKPPRCECCLYWSRDRRKDCRQCGGTAIALWPSGPAGVLLGQTFDRMYLARLLATAPADVREVRASISTKPGRSPLREDNMLTLWAPTWRGVLMNTSAEPMGEAFGDAAKAVERSRDA